MRRRDRPRGKTRRVRWPREPTLSEECSLAPTWLKWFDPAGTCDREHIACPSYTRGCKERHTSCPCIGTPASTADCTFRWRAWPGVEKDAAAWGPKQGVRCQRERCPRYARGWR